MITKDKLWKAIIRDLFPEFLQYFFPKEEENVDWTKGFEFLDKELEKIYPESKGQGRKADLLAKVFLKSGAEQWILVHIEVQGYKDEDFQKRMFIYNYRIFDRLNKKITALAIFTDDDTDYHPKFYEYELWKTKLRYDFATYKLLNKSVEDFEKSKNPFSIVMKTAWYGLQKNALSSDDDLLNLKVQLIKELFKHNFSKKRIRNILDFISHYTRFSKKNNDLYLQKLEFETDKITNKKMAMTISEVIKQGYIEEKTAEAKEKAKIDARKEMITLLLKKNKSIQEVAELLEQPIEFVEQVHKELKQKDN